MDYWKLPEWSSFLDAMRANPDDDNIRMVAGSWLGDREEWWRSELIQVQCRIAELVRLTDHEVHNTGLCSPYCKLCPELAHLHRREYQLFEAYCATDPASELGLPNHETLYPTSVGLIHPPTKTEFAFNRGFITAVSGSLATLGYPCGRCDGHGIIGGWTGDGQQTPVDWEEHDCSECGGTGGERGVLHTMLAREPLLPVGIVVTDREPWDLEGGGSFCWWRGNGPQVTTTSTIPPCVFNAMIGDNIQYGAKVFVSSDSARLALGIALFNLNRQPQPA